MNYFAIPGVSRANVVSTRDQYYIIQLVSDFTSVPIDKMKSSYGTRTQTEARQMAMYLVKKYTTLMLGDIGKLFGGKDHTTVMYSIQTAKDLQVTDEVFRDKLLLIETKLTS